MRSKGTRWCHQIPPSGFGKHCRRGRGKSVRATEDEGCCRESNQGLLDTAELARVGIHRDSGSMRRTCQVCTSWGPRAEKKKRETSPHSQPRNCLQLIATCSGKINFLPERVSPGKLTTRTGRLHAKQYTASTKQTQQRLWIFVSQC